MTLSQRRVAVFAGTVSDSTWRDEFLALLLETDRHLVALDLRSWPRAVPGSPLSVIEHLQRIHKRWRIVPRIAPDMFVPAVGGPVARPDPMARAARPAAVLRSWRHAGWVFPDHLTLSMSRSGKWGIDQARRQYDAELAALRRCLAAVSQVADREK